MWCHISLLFERTHIFLAFASGKFNNLEVEDAERNILFFSKKTLYLGKKHCSSFGFQYFAIQIQIKSEYFDYINRNSEA